MQKNNNPPLFVYFLIDSKSGVLKSHIDKIDNVSSLLSCLEKHRLFGPYNMLFLPLVLAIVRENDDPLVKDIRHYALGSNETKPLITLGKITRKPGKYVWGF